MKIAFLYAGQGSQYIGMGQSIYKHYSIARSIFDSIQIDFDIKTCCFEGPEEMLNATEYTQPCMVLIASAISAILKEKGIVPDVVAGLSLGEYSALQASGVFDVQTAVDLVRFRGKAMEKAASGIDCSMKAVLGTDRQNVEKACKEASIYGVVEVANYNCPGQIVIAGVSEACNYAVDLLKDMKVKRILPLKVSGPFHTSLLKQASRDLKEKFKEIDFNDMRIPVIFNATASFKEENQTVNSLLEKQVMSSVYFEDSIRLMINQGVDTFVEIGPGIVLSGFVKKINKSVKILHVEDYDSLEFVVKDLKGVNHV